MQTYCLAVLTTMAAYCKALKMLLQDIHHGNHSTIALVLISIVNCVCFKNAAVH